MIIDLVDRELIQGKTAKLLGISQGLISHRLAYLKLIPKLREKAKRGEISRYIAWRLC